MTRSMRVLACTVPGSEPRLRRVLPDAQLQVVLTTAEALEILRREVFDLFNRPPIVGIRGAATEVVISPHHFDLPMWAMGACGVIDFNAVPDNEVGDRHIRERLIRCAGGPAPNAKT